MKCPMCHAPLVIFSEDRESECVNPDCRSHYYRREKPVEPVKPYEPGPGERWAKDSDHKRLENALKVFLESKETRAFLDKHDPKAVEQALNALNPRRPKIRDEDYHDKSNPGGCIWSADRIVGKTVSSMAQGDHAIFKEPRTPGDEPIRKAPFVTLHFTDGTHVRLEACESGLQEDFGDGRGPQRLMTIPYIGVTDWSEHANMKCEKCLGDHDVGQCPGPKKGYFD